MLSRLRVSPLDSRLSSDGANVLMVFCFADTQVQTYALQAYSPASFNGDDAMLLTKWLGYIPTSRVNDLATYIKTPNSPLYTQQGIPGQLALQIDSSYPLVGSTSADPGMSTSSTSKSKDDNKRRDLIIGICVGVGGALWLCLAFWIYRRVKRNHDAKLHKRMSERSSMPPQDGATGYASGVWGAGPARHSRSSSLAASEIDNRPSSFYANEEDNFVAARKRRSSVGHFGSDDAHTTTTNGAGAGPFADSYQQPMQQGQARPVSGIGSSWFRSSHGSGARDTDYHPGSNEMAQNPFADIVHRSYLEQQSPRSAWRASTLGKPIDKRMIGAPTFQSNSLEFTGYNR